MKLPLFQVDAFTSEVFRGNPAAIVPLHEPLADATMQAIAAENALSETAYVRLDEGDGSAQAPWPLRWFTPVAEVDLCGHATLASAWVLFAEGLARGEAVHFASASGPLATRFSSITMSPGALTESTRRAGKGPLGLAAIAASASAIYCFSACASSGSGVKPVAD